MSFPRVLIFGQPFNNFSGGGITLTNLFKGWPKENIAVTYIGHGLQNVTTDVCDTYYQLGREEHKWLFPFNLVQRKFASGIKVIEKRTNLPYNSFQMGLRYKLVNGIFYPFLNWIGLFHAASKISLSERFKKWLSEFRPEILYLQVSTREAILFASDLCDYLKIPSVVHIMDDWFSIAGNSGLLKGYWSNRINSEFADLLCKTDLHLSISEAMSNEYLKRYNKEFVPFHNPIDTNLWLTNSKRDFSLDRQNIVLLYSGRVGLGISESLLEIASALSILNKEELTVKLHIQTPTRDPRIMGKLIKQTSISINEFVSLKDLPKVFSSADILLLANDFSMEGFTYLRLSMPTKASEYMISGTPVLVYSAPETAVSEFFCKNECGYCVTLRDRNEIVKAIRFLVNNEEYRRKISQNAVQIAKERFDARIIRNEFQQLLVELNGKNGLLNNQGKKVP
jgi:glycosyltransferase involved in cell wall biosynthesis